MRLCKGNDMKKKIIVLQTQNVGHGSKTSLRHVQTIPFDTNHVSIIQKKYYYKYLKLLSDTLLSTDS